LDPTHPPSPPVNPKHKNQAQVRPITEFHPTIYVDSLRVDWSQEEQDTDKSDIDSELESGDDYEFNTEDWLDAMKILSKKLAYDDLEWLPVSEMGQIDIGRKKRRILNRPKLQPSSDWMLVHLKSSTNLSTVPGNLQVLTGWD
jgi:hypothetical protein